MSIYLKMEGIQGSVTAKGHEGWLELHGVDWGFGRNATTKTGTMNNRTVGIPQFSNVKVIKSVDKSSPLLFSRACQGAIKGDVIIHACQTSDHPEMYLEYTLSNALISHFDHHGMSCSDENEFLETVDIHFSKMKMRYVPRDASNNGQSPISSGYNLITAEVL